MVNFVKSFLIFFSSPEGGGQFPSRHHDGDACRRRNDDSTYGSQNPSTGSPEADLQVPTVLRFQSVRRTSAVAFTCQTRERADAPTCQVCLLVDSTDDTEVTEMMNVDFRNEKWMWPYCNEHLCFLQTCFSLHQSVCLSNQTSQVSFTDQETGENTKCSRLRIHTSPPGLSDHTNHHHHAVLLLQVSGSAEVLPPWKQGDYMAEASYTTMSSMTSVSSATQLHMEKHWEQQVTATREVRMETIVWSCMQSLFNQQIIQGSKKTRVIMDLFGVWTWMWQQTEVNSTHVQ